MFSGPCRDQWTEGKYDYTLALKLFDCLEMEPWDIFEAVHRLSIVVREIRHWIDYKREREKENEQFDQDAQKALSQL